MTIQGAQTGFQPEMVLGGQHRFLLLHSTALLGHSGQAALPCVFTKTFNGQKKAKSGSRYEFLRKVAFPFRMKGAPSRKMEVSQSVSRARRKEE